jgi:hypothetical protein
MCPKRATPVRQVFLAVEFAFYVGAASTLTLRIAALIVAH